MYVRQKKTHQCRALSEKEIRWRRVGKVGGGAHGLMCWEDEGHTPLNSWVEEWGEGLLVALSVGWVCGTGTASLPPQAPPGSHRYCVTAQFMPCSYCPSRYPPICGFSQGHPAGSLLPSPPPQSLPFQLFPCPHPQFSLHSCSLWGWSPLTLT